MSADNIPQAGARAIRFPFMTFLWPLIGLACLVGLWQAAVSLFQIPALILPAPASVWSALLQFRQLIWQGTLVTLNETLLGFLLAVAIGIPLAILLSEVQVLRQTLYPLLVVAQSVPKPAIAPLVLVWLGFGLLPKLAVAFLVAFFPIVIDTATGLQAVDPDLLDLMRSLKAGRLRTLRTVKLPSALPNIFAGLKVSVTLALIGAVIAEFVGSTAGLGYLVLNSTSQSEIALTFAALVMLGVVGIVLFEALQALETLLLPWAFRHSPN